MSSPSPLLYHPLPANLVKGRLVPPSQVPAGTSPAENHLGDLSYLKSLPLMRCSVQDTVQFIVVDPRVMRQTMQACGITADQAPVRPWYQIPIDAINPDESCVLLHSGVVDCIGLANPVPEFWERAPETYGRLEPFFPERYPRYAWRSALIEPYFRIVRGEPTVHPFPFLTRVFCRGHVIRQVLEAAPLIEA